jgi:hypothetical protein
MKQDQKTPSDTPGNPGYMKDHRGRLIPTDLIKPIDKKRDAVVAKIAEEALVFSAQLADFKARAMALVTGFMQSSAREHGVSFGGVKGNVTLMSFGGGYKVQIAIADRIIFDERLQIAKQLIDTCIKRWTEGSRSEIRVLIDSAFEVDKTGKINTERILGLRRLKITDKKWVEAMSVISDSVQVASSKSYIRMYKRDEKGEYKQILLDFASL